MMPADEQLLDAIASQARMAYAATQLAACQAALHLWQQRTEQRSGEFSPERIQHELTYYIQQAARWQQYLTELGPKPQIVYSSVGAK